MLLLIILLFLGFGLLLSLILSLLNHISVKWRGIRTKCTGNGSNKKSNTKVYTTGNTVRKKKIINPSDGEYVDYTEV